MKEKIQNLLDIAPRTYYLWKKEGRPIINFLEKYFTDNDIEEFLQSGKIAKMEAINYFLYQQTESFFDFYKKIDGSSNAWRVFHIEVHSERKKYDDEMDFANNTIKSLISLANNIYNFSPCIKIINNLTPPVLWFINLLKKDNLIMKEYITHQRDKETAELYMMAFNLRTELAIRNLTICLNHKNEKFSIENWSEVRSYILFDFEQFFNLIMLSPPSKIKLVTTIVKEMSSNIDDMNIFYDFGEF